MTAKRIDQVASWLTLAIVAIAFAISFGALRDLAGAVGMSYPALYPLMIDAGLVVYNLMALRASLYGERSRYAWGLIITTTIASVLLNVFHAIEELPTWLARVLGPVMAAIPPLVIFGAFHLVVLRIEQNARRTKDMGQGRGSEGQSGTVVEGQETGQGPNDPMPVGQVAVPKMAEPKGTVPPVPEGQNGTVTVGQMPDRQKNIQGQNDPVPPGQNGSVPARQSKTVLLETAKTPAAEKNKSSVAARREQVQALLDQGRTREEIAVALSVSLRTVGRDIQALNGRQGQSE